MRTKAQESALDQLQTLEALDEKSSNKFPVQRPVASVKLLVPVQPLQTEVKKRSNAQQLADDNSLVNYIQAQLKKSVSEDKLRKVLLHAGWPQQKIDFAFKSIKK
jgi:hypothetical protein